MEIGTCENVHDGGYWGFANTKVRQLGGEDGENGDHSGSF